MSVKNIEPNKHRPLYKSFWLHSWVQLPIDNVSMSVGHLDHVLLTVYSSMEHVTWKSPGSMCCWVGRTLRPDSYISGSSWSKVPLLSNRSVAVPLCRPLLPCPSRWGWFSSTAWVCDGWLVSTVTLSVGNYTQLCSVRSFCILDCTNWMNPFDNIVIVTL